MAHTVNVNFKLDEDVKKDGTGLCRDGPFYERCVYDVCKKVGREYRIPFEVSADPFYSESNLRHLESVMQDVKDGKAHFAEHDLIEVD